MTPDKIKNKLESFVAEYQEKLGTFNGNLVIFDFIEFIKTNSTVKAIMKDQFAYFESQKEIIIKMTDEELDAHLPGSKVFDPEKPDTWPGQDIFAKEYGVATAIMKDSQPFSQIEMNLPVCLTNLIVIHELISKAKEELKDNPEKSEELTQTIKELATTSLPFKFKDKNEEKSFSLVLPAYYLNCLAVVCSYIFSELDAREFLKGNKPNPPISFDPKNSILYIRGQEIKITLKNAEPYDHYILAALFKNDDLHDKAYYSEITDDYFEGEENKHRGFYSACENLNDKIAKQTNNTILDFIIYTSGKTGWCKINQKYL